MTGEAQFHLGNCMDVMRTMADGSVDAVITDIPYNEVNKVPTSLDSSKRIRKLHVGDADIPTVPIRGMAAEFARVSAGWVIIFCGTSQTGPLQRVLARAGMSVRHGVYIKTNPTPLNGEYFYLAAVENCVLAKHPGAPFYRFCKPAVWSGPNDQDIDWHPTPKPLWLMREVITATVPAGGVVFDAMMGSGTTGVAALEEGRRFIGCELNAEWFTKARERVRGAQYGLFAQPVDATNAAVETAASAVTGEPARAVGDRGPPLQVGSGRSPATT